MKIYWSKEAKSVKLEIDDKFDVNDIIEIRGVNPIGKEGAMYFMKAELLKSEII